MKSRHSYQLIAVLAIAGFLGLAANAQAGTHTFSGSCEISGPITPQPGITIVPAPGAQFSFHGTGQCDGRLDGRRKRTMDATIDFVDVKTLFDTCELGPDFDLHGLLTITGPRGRTAGFPVRLDLARVAIAGPFTLRANRGGLALGVAQFSPADVQQALMQCAGAGLTEAKLRASFDTVSPLVGGRKHPVRR